MTSDIRVYITSFIIEHPLYFRFSLICKLGSITNQT